MTTNQNLLNALLRHAVEVPDAPFLVVPGGRVWTYGDVVRLSARLADRLAASGARQGERVAVQVEKSPEAVALYLACLRLGAIYLPLNPAYRSAEVGYFLADAEPAVMVCDPARRREIGELARPGCCILTLDADGGGSLLTNAGEACGELPIAVCADDDVAAILYTSGTTGRSKGAMLTHGNLRSNAETLVDVWGMRTDDVLIHALPLYHVHGLFVALHCTMLAGARAIFLSRFDAAEVVRLLPRATILMGVPTFYSRLLGEPGLDVAACRSMRLFISGSAPLSAEIFHAFHQRTGHAILERYGMTEAGMICSNPLHGERVAGTVGYPLPGVEIRVVGDDGRQLPDGEVGSLEVRGPNVFAGYWRMPEKTAAEFRPDGFFVTGDLARRFPDGRIELVGRSKDLIISGGLNVYPKEVELALDRLEGIAESAVVGVPHPDFGEAVVAAVVRAPGGEGLTEEQVRTRLRSDLAGYKVPKRIAFVDALPRNAMGKVQKNLLRQHLARLV